MTSGPYVYVHTPRQVLAHARRRPKFFMSGSQVGAAIVPGRSRTVIMMNSLGKELDSLDDLDLEEVGLTSMLILTGKAEDTGQKVNGKEAVTVPVPQPRPRKKLEEKQVAELVSENKTLKSQKEDLATRLDRAKRDSAAKSKQQDKLIADLKALLLVRKIVA